MLSSSNLEGALRSQITKLLGAVTLIVASTLVAPNAVAALDYDFNFEPGYNFGDDFTCAGNCPTISKQHAREGTASMKSYINRYTSDTSYRTEIKLRGSIEDKKMTFERDYWIGVSIMLPDGWTHSGGHGIVANIHGTADPGEAKASVPFEIRAGKGDWHIINRAENVQSKTYVLNSAYEDVGKWVDWVIHYRPSPTSNGVLKVWKDGTLVVNQTNRPSSTKQEIGPYWKMGIYLPWKDKNCCDDLPAEKVIFHDALRIASGPNAKYTDVAPGKGSISQPSTPTEPDPIEPDPIEPDPIDPDFCWFCPSASWVFIQGYEKNQKVSGRITIPIAATDPAGIRQVTLWADHKKIGQKSSPPYSFTLNTDNYSGKIRLVATAHTQNNEVKKHVVPVIAN